MLIASVFGLLFYSSPASAAGIINYNTTVSWDGQTANFDAGQKYFVLFASLSRLNSPMTWYGGSNISYTSGLAIYATTTIMVNAEYSSSVQPRAVDISCPVFASSSILTNSCDMDTQEVVFGSDHYLLYHFFIEGHFEATYNMQSLTLQFDIKNFSEVDNGMWVTPLTVSVGNDTYTRVRDIFVQMRDSIGPWVSSINDKLNTTNQRLSALIDAISEMSSEASVAGVIDELQEQNDKDDQDRSNLNNQQSSATSAAQSSQQDAQNAGTTLLAAFQAFVSALTNATPSNCVIDMDLGNLDLGDVDLCTLSPPSGFQAIGSILLIGFCVPLSIATATKMIALFRSFSG